MVSVLSARKCGLRRYPLPRRPTTRKNQYIIWVFGLRIAMLLPCLWLS